jgi:hypothetical protein
MSGFMLKTSPVERGEGDVAWEGCAPSQPFGSEPQGRRPKRRQKGALHLQSFSGWFLAVDDIRDIRGPIHIPYPWLWVVYLLIGLVALALIYGGYRLWKKRAKQVPVKLPHEIALERLEKARHLISENKANEFSVEVSDVVRIYIEARFQVAAAHRTTEEFLHDLLKNAQSPLAPYSTSLQEFLTHCDLAKFARWSLSAAEMQSMYESAKRLVTGTIPPPEDRNKNLKHQKAAPPSKGIMKTKPLLNR